MQILRVRKFSGKPVTVHKWQSHFQPLFALPWYSMQPRLEITSLLTATGIVNSEAWNPVWLPCHCVTFGWVLSPIPWAAGLANFFCVLMPTLVCLPTAHKLGQDTESHHLISISDQTLFICEIIWFNISNESKPLDLSLRETGEGMLLEEVTP